jgi:hypothetical protein
MMEGRDGFYAIIQFSPTPERFEFLNVGALLVVPSRQYVGVRITSDFRRLDRLFGRQSRSYLTPALEGIKQRLGLELRGDLSREKLAEFGERRANRVRLSKLQSVLVDEPEEELDRLFGLLVGEEPRPAKRQRVSTKLRNTFSKAGVIHFLDEPDPVELPEFGITLGAQYGYQNGAYNLIDAMRLGPNPSETLREAGKRAIEGQLLHQHSQSQGLAMRLVVVGDAQATEPALYKTVEEIMADHSVKLYRMDSLDPLFEDIRVNAALHA